MQNAAAMPSNARIARGASILVPDRTSPRRPADPSKKNNHENGRDEGSPPTVEAEGAERGRAELDERHDGAGPGERADEVQACELQRADVRGRACDRNRRPQPRKEPAHQDQSRLVLVHVMADALVKLREPWIAIEAVQTPAEQ